MMLLLMVTNIKEPSVYKVDPRTIDELLPTFMNNVIFSIKTHRASAVAHFCGDTNPLLDVFAKMWADGYQLTHHVDLKKMAKLVDAVMLGNLDNVILSEKNLSSVLEIVCENIEANLELQDMGRYIPTLGCDLLSLASDEDIAKDPNLVLEKLIRIIVLYDPAIFAQWRYGLKNLDLRLRVKYKF